MPAKLEDVARRAGVSTATVSRVLADKPHVSAVMRKRVLTAIEELDFRPSRVARSLRAQRSQVLGLIISDIQNPFFTSLVRAIEDIAYRHQYSLILCNADENPEKEALYIDLMVAEKVAGVIISPTRETDTSCKRLADVGIAVVAIDRRTLKSQVDTVVVDNVDATFKLINHLIDDGHERIGAVLGVPAATTGHERRAGYIKALQAHQLPVLPELIWAGTPNVETGYRLVNELLDLSVPPTALFMGNNLLTIGALKAIHARALQIPTDVALVAFDEMEWMFVMQPALTVVAQPVYEMGKIAAELLLARLADGSRLPQEVVLQPTVHIRQSCADHTKART
jgi:DNA-binding LacI/PurR family transcriptional regulator